MTTSRLPVFLFRFDPLGTVTDVGTTTISIVTPDGGVLVQTFDTGAPLFQPVEQAFEVPPFGVRLGRSTLGQGDSMGVIRFSFDIDGDGDIDGIDVLTASDFAPDGSFDKGLLFLPDPVTGLPPTPTLDPAKANDLIDALLGTGGPVDSGPFAAGVPFDPGALPGVRVIDRDVLFAPDDLPVVWSTGNGSDLVTGGGGDDRLDLGRGNDRGAGRGGNDVIAGGRGNDLLDGDQGNNTLKGGGGNDRLIADGTGRTTMIGGTGADTFEFAHGPGFGNGVRVVVGDFTGDGQDDSLHYAGEFGGGLPNADALVLEFGEITARGALLDFGNGNSVLFRGHDSFDAITPHIVIIVTPPDG